MIYTISKYFSANIFKWIDPKSIESNKYSSDSSRKCVLETDLEYPKELH